MKHKIFQGIATQSGDLLYGVAGEAVIYEFVLFVFQQPRLKSSQPPVPLKAEHIDELVQIKSGPVGAIR